MSHSKCKQLPPLFKEVLHTMEENTGPSQILCVVKMWKKKKKRVYTYSWYTGLYSIWNWNIL